MEEERKKWFVLAVDVQAVRQLGRDKINTKTEGDKGMPPPPYSGATEPTAPPVSIYPVLEDSGGKFTIETAGGCPTSRGVLKGREEDDNLPFKARRRREENTGGSGHRGKTSRGSDRREEVTGHLSGS